MSSVTASMFHIIGIFCLATGAIMFIIAVMSVMATLMSGRGDTSRIGSSIACFIVGFIMLPAGLYFMEKKPAEKTNESQAETIYYDTQWENAISSDYKCFVNDQETPITNIDPNEYTKIIYDNVNHTVTLSQIDRPKEKIT